MINRKALLISIVVGAIAGQIVAEGERSWTLTNTLRVGYDDNVYREDGNEDDSFFIKDIIDLGWRASLSDRTDFTLKTQIIALSDEDQNLYPNVYALLNHSVSPRVLMSLSDYFRSDDRTGDVTGNDPDERYNYYLNEVKLDSSYVAGEKTRLQLSLANAIERNDSEIEEYDTTRNTVGVSVGRELQPQQTRLTVGASFSDLQYENLDSDYQQATASATLGHTFNPQWSCEIGGGVDSIDANYYGDKPDDTFTQPRANAGIKYEPSPRTRISGSYAYSYETTANTDYIGSMDQEVRLGVQHDLTAKFTVQGSARMVDRNYEEEDQQESGVADADEERMYLSARVSYQLNRNHYLEAGYEFVDIDRAEYDDWQQNKVDVGWRVEM